MLKNFMDLEDKSPENLPNHWLEVSRLEPAKVGHMLVVLQSHKLKLL